MISKRTQYWLVFFIIFSAVVLFLLGHKQKPSKGTSAATKRNVYLITAGGLRADRLGIYNYQPIQTPGIDYLAGDGVLFLKAFTASTSTLSAHISILTGQYPFSTVKTNEENLPQRLRALGYRTVAIVSDPELREAKEFRLFFDQFVETESDPAGQALQWILNNRSAPQFVLINLAEPAPPFTPPPPFDRHYENHPIDGETAAVDGQIASLIHHIKRAGLFAQSIVILTSAYPVPLEEGQPVPGDSNLQVPLIVAAEGLLPQKGAYQNPVSHIDIFPTIVLMLEMAVPRNLDGQPLFLKGSDQQIGRPEILLEWSQSTGTIEYFRRKESGEYLPFSPE